MSQGGARGLTIAGTGAFTGGVSNVGNTGGTTGMVASQILFVGSNNISLSQSTNGNSATVSIYGGAGGGGGGIAAAAGTQTGTSGTINFANSNGITFGMSGSTQITASHNGLTSQSNQALSGSNGSFTFQTATFGNLNGASFYTSNGSLVASYTVPSTAGLISAVNFSAGTTSNNSASIWLRDSNGVSFGLDAGTITATVRTDWLSTQSNQALSGSNGSFTFQTATFGNLNGLSFYTSNNSLVGSYTVPSTAGLISNVNVSAGTTSNNLSAFVLSNSNNVSFGLNGSTLTATVTVPAQTNQTVGIYGSSQTTGQSSSSTYDARSLTIRGAGIVSVGNSGGEIIISATGGGAGGGVAAAAGTQTGTSGTIVFADSNGVSFGMSGSSQITATVRTDWLSTQSNQALSGSNGSFTFQTATFGNLNGLSFYTSNGSLVGSYTVPSVPAQTNQTIGLYGVSNTTGASSSSTVDARSFSIQGAGIASVGLTNGSFVISVPAGGGAGDGVNIIAAGTQTANTTGTVSLANSNGFQFGMSNSSVVTIAANPMSYFEPYQWLTGQNMAAGSLLLQPIWVPARITATQGDILVHLSNSTNAGGTVSVLFGLYTYSGSTASLYSSTSYSVGYNSTAAASSYSNVSGTRFWSVSLGSWNVTQGQYLQAVGLRSSSSGTSGTISVFGRTANGLNQPLFAAAGSTFTSWGQGYYNATTGGFPGSIHISEYIQTGSTAPRQPWMRLIGTV